MKRLRKEVLVTAALLLLLGVGACAVPEEESGESSLPQGPAATEEPATAQNAGVNKPPVVLRLELTPNDPHVARGSTIYISCAAVDPDGDLLKYEWAATGGSFHSITGNTCVWRAPKVNAEFIVSVTIKDSRGGITEAQQVLIVVENQNPVIRSLTANPYNVEVGGMSILNCFAEDPDGDDLDYAWKCDGGEITGVGDTVTWITPKIVPGEPSDFLITLTVNDGKGGFDVENVSLHVDIPYITEVFSPLPMETGTVCSDGSEDTRMTMAGDNENNESYQAFWSFDLYSLRATRVVKATLSFKVRDIVQDPFQVPSGLGGLHIYQVYAEPGGLPDYNITPLKELTESALWESPKELDVTERVAWIGLGIAKSDRLQVMASFLNSTNRNCIDEYIIWDKVLLTVTYAPE